MVSVVYFVRCSVGVSVCFVCCVFVSVCELFGKTIHNMFWCDCYFVVNVMAVIVWVEVLCWIDRVWSSKECACCAYDPSVHLSVPSIGFVYVFVCRMISPQLGV